LGFLSNSTALNMSNSPNSIAGTQNMLTTSLGGGTGTAYYWSSTVRNADVDWGWSYGQGNGQSQWLQKMNLNVNTRCVTTFFK